MQIDNDNTIDASRMVCTVHLFTPFHPSSLYLYAGADA